MMVQGGGDESEPYVSPPAIIATAVSHAELLLRILATAIYEPTNSPNA